MIRSIILIAFLVLGMVSCVVGEDEYTSGSGNVVEVGDSLPNFSVKLNNGSTLTNETLKGRVSVLTFFHTACGDCRRELPLIQEVYNEYTPQVNFVCISRAENEESVEAYWQKNGLSLPFSGQSDEAVYNLFAQHTIPRIYVIDTSGIIRYQFIESMTLNELQTSLHSLLSE